jgi:hypothetical protein
VAPIHLDGKYVVYWIRNAALGDMTDVLHQPSLAHGFGPDQKRDMPRQFVLSIRCENVPFQLPGQFRRVPVANVETFCHLVERQSIPL